MSGDAKWCKQQMDMFDKDGALGNSSCCRIYDSLEKTVQ